MSLMIWEMLENLTFWHTKHQKTQTLITTFQYVCKYTGKKCCAQRIEATTSHSFKSSGVAHITHCSPTVVGGSNWKTKERIQRKHKTCERSDSQHRYPSPLFLEKTHQLVCQAYLQSRVDVVGVIHTGEGAPSMIQIKKSLTHCATAVQQFQQHTQSSLFQYVTPSGGMSLISFLSWKKTLNNLVWWHIKKKSKIYEAPRMWVVGRTLKTQELDLKI